MTRVFFQQSSVKSEAITMSSESSSKDVLEDFKGFRLHDYNSSLADKTHFQNLVSEIYTDIEIEPSRASTLSIETSMLPSETIKIASDVHDQLLGNKSTNPLSATTTNPMSPCETNKMASEGHDQLLANKLTNPLLKIPLTQYGWKREIVCRTTNSPEITSKRMYDVYYYSPTGKKLRSCTQIADYLLSLDTDLSGAHFSFSKGVIGLSSDVEWVRGAKSKPDSVQSLNSNKDIGKTIQSKSITSKPARKITQNPKKRRLSKVSLYDDVSKSSLNEDIDSKRSKAPLSEDDDSMDCDWSPTIPGTTRETMGNPLICSILCPAALGCIPTLQCTSCLCLYHPQCLNLDPDVTYHKYVCINCKKKIQDEENELHAKKEQTKTIIKITKTSSDQKVPVTKTVSNPKAPKSAVISFTSKVVPKFPQKTQKIKPPYTSSMPSLPYTINIPSKPLRPLAPVPTHNNSINVLPKPASKLEVPMQSIIQFGNKKFIAVPKQALNSILKNVPSSITDSKKSSENQLPVINRTPTVPVLPKTQFYVLKNGQMQSLLPINNQAPFASSTLTNKSCSSIANKNFLSLGCSGFHTLIKIFSYLPLCDLLRAAQVNQLFYAASRHYSLWKTVYLKDIYVKDWDKFTRCLNKNDTQVINFNKMIAKTEPEDVKIMWRSINEALGKIPTVCHLDLGRCAGPEIIIIKQCLNLTKFTCSFNKKSLLDFYGFSAVQNLTHLYIRGFELSKTIGLKVLNIHTLSKLKHLTHLALTSVKQNSQDTNWAMFLADMPQLEWLELGECTNFTNEFVKNALSKLVLLKHLRLEMVTEVIANDVINTIATLSHLNTLELINFDVKLGFEEAFCKCKNLRSVLIIPTYIKQSAVTVQRMVLALSGMNHTLKRVVWGLTMELLKVTEMLVTQHHFPLEPGVDSTNCVPIMPKIRLELENSPETKKTAQVEVITVDQLRDMLAKEIPLVEVKLIKVPYVSTLKQFIPLK